MSIKELIAVIQPPPSPVDIGLLQKRSEIECSLGVALPDDFIDVALTYGSGKFPGRIEVFNPFSKKYLDQINIVTECYRELKQAEGDEFIPYDFFPAPQGFLPWGESDKGFVFFWKTCGSPNDWPTVLVVGQQANVYESLNIKLSTFLAKAFSEPMSCVLWDVEWQRENLIGKSFQPDNS